MDDINHYRVVRELGRGAMGVVFEAYDPAIDRKVALKMIRAQPFTSAEEEAQLKLRFSREAAAAGRLSHPNIVTIYELGEHGGMQYLAMEYITGTSLEALLAPAVPLSLDTALGILAQIAAALDYAHARGVVHRDIKPANILIESGGTVKLTDFGIARITSQNITQTGVTMGTPAYMAPEQVMASKVDGRADQFSLAVIAYQMLSGKRPFEAPTEQALLFKVVSEEPRPLVEANALLPPALTQVIGRGLSKDSGARYPSCSDFVADMRSALVLPASQAATVVVEPPRLASAPQPPPAIGRHRRRLLLIAACVLLAATLVAWFGHSRYYAMKVNRKKTVDEFVLAADHVIGTYRNGDAQPIYEDGWQRAQTMLQRALSTQPDDKTVQGKLHLCEAHIARMEGEAHHNVAELNGAIQEFQQAQQLMPQSPDPPLGLAHVYLSLGDVDKAVAASHQAETNGYQLGNSERSQLADGYRDRANRTWSAAAAVRGLPQEKEQIQQVANDYRRALDLYKECAGWGNAGARVKEVGVSLASANTRLQQIAPVPVQPQPVPDATDATDPGAKKHGKVSGAITGLMNSLRGKSTKKDGSAH